MKLKFWIFIVFSFIIDDTKQTQLTVFSALTISAANDKKNNNIQTHESPRTDSESKRCRERENENVSDGCLVER